MKSVYFVYFLLVLFQSCTPWQSPTVNESNSASTSAPLFWTPLAADFGPVNIGSNSTSQLFRLKNNGSQVSSCSNPVISDNINFTILSNTCGINNLNTASTCDVLLQAHPVTSGLKSTTLSRSCVTGGIASTTANLITATGTLPQLNWTPLINNFGLISLGSNSATQIFTLSNSGDGVALTCSMPLLSDVINFTIISNTCGTNNLSAGANCELVIRANPTLVGISAATINRTCANTGSISTTSNQITVTGILPILNWAPLVNNFGTVSIGSNSASQVFVLTNSGLVDAKFCSIPTIDDSTNFSIMSNTCGILNLNSLASCDVTIQAHPKSSGIKSTTLTRICGYGGTATTTSQMITASGQVTAMNVARYGHTSTTLQDGKVLVVGGYNGSYVSNVELYDPTLNTWTTKASMSISRYNHTANLLQDGKVIIIGGYNSGFLNSVEIYDPAANTWTTKLNLPISRNGHQSNILADGNILVTGGYNGSYLNSVYIYNVLANTWTMKNSMAYLRDRHTATFLSNGKILVAGGYNGGTYLATSEIYDPSNNTWTAGASMAISRYYHTATTLQNGSVLVVGGTNGSALSSTEIYDPTANTWATKMNLGYSVSYHTANILSNGKILITGGDNSGVLNNVTVYDPFLDTWTAQTPLQSGRYFQTASTLVNGKILVCAGYNGSYLASCELLN